MTPSLAAGLLLLVPLIVIAGIYGNGWLYALVLARLFYVRVRGLHRISWLPAAATVAASLVLGLFYTLSESAGNLAVGIATLVTSPLVVQHCVPDEAGEAITAAPAWLAWGAVLVINLVMAIVFAIILFAAGLGSLALLAG